MLLVWKVKILGSKEGTSKFEVWIDEGKVNGT